MKTFRHHLSCAFVAALVAGCGGGDPAEPQAVSRSEAPAARAGIARATAPGAADATAVRAGAATTQAAIDSLIAANLAAAATTPSR